MADLGTLLGSLMSGLISARRMADEQTAALAEYYKSNPLLEGLSVPRIRIPELTIDMPVLFENYVIGEIGAYEDSAKIAAEIEAQLRLYLSKSNTKLSPTFYKTFTDEVIKQLELLKNTDSPIVKEAVARSVQGAFSDVLTRTKTTLLDKEKEIIAKALREKVHKVCVAKEAVKPNIEANIKTADVKEKATSSSVVRLKITLKEEGLEWATQASENGGVVRTLQPE